MDEDAIYFGNRFAKDLMTNPPAKLTKRGLAMLIEIWIAAGRPAKPKDSTVMDYVMIANLESHHETDAKRRAAARIRGHLFDGGYLHTTDWQSEDDIGTGVRYLHELGLSDRAFDALIEAGVIQ